MSYTRSAACKAEAPRAKFRDKPLSGGQRPRFSHSAAALLRLSSCAVGHTLFTRRTDGEAAESEFAATVVSVPCIDDGETDSLGPSDSAVPDICTDFGTDFGADSPPHADDAATAAKPTLSSIGRYALKQQLGQGGLGTVFEAWDPLLSRMVAVKTLQFDTDTPTRVSLDALFLNEARTAAGLNHSHIVTVHDAGLSAHGVYIAMERLRGRDLRQALQSDWRATPAEVALLVRRVADALGYAHARGVVHCDIKPANIFLTRRDRPKVLDFGIARVAHHAALPDIDGMIAGSPHYQAPEQLDGRDVDARTDIYALGTVMYELLTARKAFDGDSLDAIRAAVVGHTPTPPHELCPEVPVALSAIAMRAMARSPDERFASAADMAQALRQWLAAQPAKRAAAEAPHDPAATDAPHSPPAPTHRRLVWLVAALAALSIAAVLVVRGGPERTPAPAAPAEEPHPPLATAPVAVAPPAFAVADVAADPAAAAPGATAAPTASVMTASSEPAKPSPPRSKPARKPPPRATEISAAATSAAPPPAKGTVNIAISPWGEVEVDGTPVGTTPPLTRMELPSGTHTVTVRNADFPPHTQRVTVDPERPVSVKHRFGS